MDNLQILALYEDVAQITSRMLTAARTGDWEKLSELEKHCSEKVSVLRGNEAPTPLPAEQRERKVAVIRKILADDKAIRDITEPWMKQLSSRILSVSTERKLNAVYGKRYPG